MLKVIIESPYAGDIAKNIEYAKQCVKHSLSLGEAPLASHLLYTQRGILDDDIPEDRRLGIDAGLAWLPVADKHVFYCDYGWSSGMLAALETSKQLGITTESRTILV